VNTVINHRFHKMLGSSLVVAQLAVSQKGLSSGVSLVRRDNRRFGRTCRLHLQDRRTTYGKPALSRCYVYARARAPSRNF
jgi:hypothetical protein